MLGCNHHKQSAEPKVLDLPSLWKAERIIPCKSGDLLLESQSDPGNDHSRRELLLYNAKNEFLDAIAIFGTVQEVETDKIYINHAPNDYWASNSIGDLKIEYVTLKWISKGGGGIGSFLVDSIRYHQKNRKVDLYLRKPVEQFITDLDEVGIHWSEFIIAEKRQVALQDIDFDPVSKGRFTITRWEKDHTNSTEYFYLSDQQVLNKLFLQIIENRIK